MILSHYIYLVLHFKNNFIVIAIIFSVLSVAMLKSSYTILITTLNVSCAYFNIKCTVLASKSQPAFAVNELKGKLFYAPVKYQIRRSSIFHIS